MGAIAGLHTLVGGAVAINGNRQVPPALLLGEVRRLLDTEGFEESAAAQAVGYRQVVNAFRHNNLHKVLAQPWIYEGRWQTKVVHNLFCDVQTTTRRLARRQFNWFRGDDAFSWIDIEANDPRQVSSPCALGGRVTDARCLVLLLLFDVCVCLSVCLSALSVLSVLSVCLVCLVCLCLCFRRWLCFGIKPTGC